MPPAAAASSATPQLDAASASASDVTRNDAASCQTLFESPAGADHLCDEHVLANTGELHWSSYGAREPRGLVDARYREWATRCGAEIEVGAQTLLVSRGPWRVSTHDAAAHDYPTCGTAPSPRHTTVIVVSRMLPR
jgi:hypothetical protein